MKVAEALRSFKQFHNTDPRSFLDNYFWNILIEERLYKRGEGILEILNWCKNQFDSDDYVQIGNKFWFTNRDQHIQFWLTWEEYLTKDIE